MHMLGVRRLQRALPRMFRQRRFQSVSVEEARKRMRVAHESAKVHEAAKARGARTVSAQTVDTGFSVVFGLCIACWYFDWFSAWETTPLERLAAWLRERHVAVVAFELDGVICCRSRGKQGVSLFQLEDYFGGVSQDFAELAPALARRSYPMAVVIRGASAAEEGRTFGWRQKEVKAPEFVDGPELARKLLVSRCPGAADNFKIFVTDVESSKDTWQSTDECIQRIAKEHRVPARQVVIFTASRACEQDGGNEEWTGIRVPNAKEGFRYSDLQLPSMEEEGPLSLPLTRWWNQAVTLITSKRP
ncbi:unnamed protein product [Durusdinium trenchii]|uniref:Uncharacterized protein n=1 Tax=Durusdinium trenchii TaxID=1381693 RepID=A0ABP0MKL5_9DINO